MRLRNQTPISEPSIGAECGLHPHGSARGIEHRNQHVPGGYRLRVKDPDSVKFEDITFHEKKNGTWRIQQTFRANNGFNATRLGTSECYVRSGKLINMKDLR
jgi:hypothetical protein